VKLCGDDRVIRIESVGLRKYPRYRYLARVRFVKFLVAGLDFELED